MLSVIEQAPSVVPDWYRFTVLGLAFLGLLTGLVFLIGFLTRKPVRYKRMSLFAVDQWLFYAVMVAVCLNYVTRFLFNPPTVWAGPGSVALVIAIGVMIDVAFIIRLITWRRMVLHFRDQRDMGFDPVPPLAMEEPTRRL